MDRWTCLEIWFVGCCAVALLLLVMETRRDRRGRRDLEQLRRHERAREALRGR